MGIADWPWAFRVTTLGRFSLLRHGEPVTFSGKAQRRPLELLRVLIAHGGREVTEERVTEALWPRIVNAIRADARLRFDLIDLRKMPAEIGGLKNPLLALRATRHPDDAHVATLGGDWERF